MEKEITFSVPVPQALVCVFLLNTQQPYEVRIILSMLKMRIEGQDYFYQKKKEVQILCSLNFPKISTGYIMVW